MAKSAFPLKTGSGPLPKLIGLLVLAAVVTLVVKDPVDAATWARALFQLLGTVIDSIGTFLRTSINH